jgi:hypothetical protein
MIVHYGVHKSLPIVSILIRISQVRFSYHVTVRRTLILSSEYAYGSQEVSTFQVFKLKFCSTCAVTCRLERRRCLDRISLGPLNKRILEVAELNKDQNGSTKCCGSLIPSLNRISDVVRAVF